MKVPAGKKYGVLDAWIEALPAQGRYSFTRDEAMTVLGLSRMTFKRSAGRLAARKKIARIHGQFYIVVPPEYAAAGVLPVDWFIVKFMEYLGRPFYAGVLTAAEYHGAAHQRPQRYQVVTDRPLRAIACRGMGISFFVRKNTRNIPVQQVKGVTGYIPVSTPEATALDLIRYSRRIGGLNRVLTVLQELGEVINPVKLVVAAKLDGSIAYAQRLGWLLGQGGFAARAVRLARWVAGRKPLPVRLAPSVPLRGSRRDKRWNLWVNEEVAGDLP